MSVYFTSLYYYFLIQRVLLMCFPDKRYFWYSQILLSNSIYIQENFHRWNQYNFYQTYLWGNSTKDITFFCYFLYLTGYSLGFFLQIFNAIQNYFKHLQLFKTVVHKYVNFANLRKCREQEAYGNCKQNNFSLNTSSAHVVK